MSTPARRTTLRDLPHEVLESLLAVQPPETICAAAQACRDLRNAATPAVWRKASTKMLRTPVASAKEARAQAETLVFGWRAAAGALVRGVPVHFRHGFRAVRPRGGALVRVRAAEDDAVFAMGTTLRHAPPPALELDFLLAADAPFPEQGLVARVVAAPVPRRDGFPTGSTPPGSPPASPPVSPPPAGMAAPGNDEAKAAVRLVLNGVHVATHTADGMCRFDMDDFELPANLLRANNTLAVEFDGPASDAEYWLKAVRVVPKGLPFAPEEPIEDVPLRHVRLAPVRSQGYGGLVDRCGVPGGSFKIGSPPRNRFAYSYFQRLNLGV